MRYEDEGSQVVSEFDYRQNLHMECGVVALEPPPPYTAVEKDLEQQTQEGAASEEEVEGEERNYAAVLCMRPRNTRESPPPYDERDRARRIKNMVSKAVRVVGRRNSEAIQLGTLQMRESSSSNGSSDDPDVSGV